MPRNNLRGMLRVYKGKGRSVEFSLCQDKHDYPQGYFVYEDKDKQLKPTDNWRQFYAVDAIPQIYG